LVSLIGSDGGANNGKIRALTIEHRTEFFPRQVRRPAMNGNSELTCPISLNDACLARRARKIPAWCRLQAQAVAGDAVDDAPGHHW